ncbi:hypothetical protein HK096_008779 [Nowakowskiella sp. JEL0078]|nr:hypothetical protein HK096_008779 [Nowakowskiella sp. JEL0078]
MAFSLSVRSKLHLKGLLPPSVDSLERQSRKTLTYLRCFESSDSDRKSHNSLLRPEIAKYLALMNIKSENMTLFYHLLTNNLSELLQIIYTPTIADVCLNYSILHTTGFADALFISIEDAHHITEILKNWKLSHPSPELCVITDGSSILGLGDMGLNGIVIPMRKLDLYVAIAGLIPSRVMPVVLDFGTENEMLLENDEFYMGLRKKREKNQKKVWELWDSVMDGINVQWTNCIIQFEDLESERALECLSRYQKYPCFNDDLQVTSAVILAGFINAIKHSTLPLESHRILLCGQGSAILAIAEYLRIHFESEFPSLSENEIFSRFFYLFDFGGMVMPSRSDITEGDEKWCFTQKKQMGEEWFNKRDISNLEEAVKLVKPTAIIGIGNNPGIFTEKIIRYISKICERPIIFPLSIPKENIECTFQQAFEFTNGRVLFISGSKFPDYLDPESGIAIQPGQGNNMFMFPGLGLGLILQKASRLTKGMLYSAANALALSLTPFEFEDLGCLFPRLNHLRQISIMIAAAVIEIGVKEDVARSLLQGNH